MPPAGTAGPDAPHAPPWLANRCACDWQGYPDIRPEKASGDHAPRARLYSPAFTLHSRVQSSLVIDIADRPGAQRGDRGPVRGNALACLSALDRDLINAVSTQRLLTALQLERLFAVVPARTLRYRTARLTRLGLLGRSRPYRDRGSAPFHYWPTRAGDTYARGAVVSRGVERSEPNPLFLAHAAGLSELYVGLATSRATDLRLRAFFREGEGRERFGTPGGPRAIAPDARLELHDAAGRLLVAHVELDRGTMSLPRLKVKAAGYVAYVVEAAWATRHPFCPCLLFVTTTEARARRFLDALAQVLRRSGRSAIGADLRFTAAACAMADEPGRALVEPCWRDLTGASGRTLADCLRAARAPYDATRARERAARNAREQRLAQLRTDPELLRQHLREQRGAYLTRYLDRVGRNGHAALDILIDTTEPLSDIEQEALAEFARFVDDDLLEFRDCDGPAAAVELLPQIGRLVDSHRAAQANLVRMLLERHGPLSCLRATQRDISAGALIPRQVAAALPERARSEAVLRAAQEQQGARYRAYRDRTARDEAGIIGQVLRRTNAIIARMDERLVRRCSRCEETIYPETADGRSDIRPSERCPYCQSSQLSASDRRCST